MVTEILPFKGLRYDLGRVGAADAVVAPPYDVISPAERDALYERHAYNIVRLDLGKESPGDQPGADKYSRARHDYRVWREDGILRKEDQPAFYVYRQEFQDAAGRARVRTGFVGLLRLANFDQGVVLPHERTLSGPKEDRLRLMQACRANFSQIFGVYWGASGDVEETLLAAAPQAPAYDVQDGDGVRHRLWVVQDEAALAETCKAMQTGRIIIADGHHRYETSLTFRDECRLRAGVVSGREGWNYVMMMCVNMETQDLTVLPTHRTVRRLPPSDLFPTGAHGMGVGNTAALGDEQVEALMDRLHLHFGLEPFQPGAGAQDFAAALADRRERGDMALVLYAGLGRAWLLVLADREAMTRRVGTSHSDAWRGLDVTVLHTLILEDVLGLDEAAQVGGGYLGYTRDIREGLREVDEERSALVFLLNPTLPDDVRAVALAGETMPQKSTYFYPKLLTGLVLNDLDQQVMAAPDAPYKPR